MPPVALRLLVLIWIVVSCTPASSPSRPVLGPPAPGDLNPGRGYYQWSGMQVVPPHAREKAAPDLYKRFTWVDFEPTPGSYDFSALTSLFDLNPGSRVSFRIRAMVDYGTANPADAIPRFVPSTIPGWEADTSGDGNPDVFIPDWNSEAFLAGVENLWKALKTELDKVGPDGKTRSSRIGWIDVGMFGQYGEWYLRTAPSGSSPWVDYGKAPAGMELFKAFADTTANPRKRLVDAQISAFPGARWVMFFLYDQREVLNYLFNIQKITDSQVPVGWRFDALGSDQFLEKQWQNTAAKLEYWNGIPGRPAFSERWKVAPVVAEYFGSTSDAAVALAQVKTFHVGLVGNGNFTAAQGTDATHWSTVAEDRRPAWAAVGAAAGWRLQAAGPGTLTVVAGQFTWTGQVTNPGSSPAWEPWGGRFTFDQGTPVDVASVQAFPLPGETLTVTLTGTLTGTLPAGITKPQAWSWVPTIRGTAAAWTGTGPAFP